MADREYDLRLRTAAFALSIVRMFVRLPKTTEAQVLGKQLLRSGTSVGANYREACRARSKAEFISKISECLREIDESSYWLELLSQAQIVPDHLLNRECSEANELTAIFVATLVRLKKQ
jgi:four helix bundle protein